MLTNGSQHGQARASDPPDFWVLGGRRFSRTLSSSKYSQLAPGALLHKPFAQGHPPAIEGSGMIAYAATRDEVVERLTRDILVTGGVWNISSLQVYSFWRPSK